MSLPETRTPTSSHVPAWLRFASLTMRTLFIIALIVLTYRVSLPQNETIATAYDTPGDLVRLALGFAVCLWLLFQLFQVPHDDAGFRTWFYLGLAAVPFTLVCLAYVW
jgi:hypothetical protein